MVFPFVWAKYKWNFMRDRCKLSFPLSLAASPLARPFSRDSLSSPKQESLLAGNRRRKPELIFRYNKERIFFGLRGDSNKLLYIRNFLFFLKKWDWQIECPFSNFLLSLTHKWYSFSFEHKWEAERWRNEIVIIETLLRRILYFGEVHRLQLQFASRGRLPHENYGDALCLAYG